MGYRNSASFGKRQEFSAIAELLKRNFDVYTTLVDDQQIDCIIRIDGDVPAYLDIQIKARSKTAKHGATFAALLIKRPRKNFFYIFYSDAMEAYWVIPSEELVQKANTSKGGKHAGKQSLILARQNKDGVWVSYPKWKEYEGAFNLLKAC